ncbi:MAG: hypothetical protein LBR65_06850 [Culturomica sp.]|jgi:hypothetical protein|nr:hypothetical protein [Culturomica sp.]
MKERYDTLRNEWRNTLTRFRLENLFSDLLRGLAVLFSFVLVYLLLYYVIRSAFHLPPPFKTTLYVLFLAGTAAITLFGLIKPLLLFFVSGNLRKDLLLQLLRKHFPGEQDLLVSLCYLAFRTEEVSGDDTLKKAAFIQKYSRMQEQNLSFPLFGKRSFKPLLLIGVCLLLFGINAGRFVYWGADLSRFREVERPESGIFFTLLNESTSVEYGKSFRVKLKVESEYAGVGNVFIRFGGGEFLMGREDSLYVYDFESVNNDLSFNFRAVETESRYYKLTVLPTPVVTAYEVRVVPPAYTGLKPEVLKNVTDFRAVYGSVLQFTVRYSFSDSLYLGWDGRVGRLNTTETGKASFSRRVTASGEYTLYGSNAHFDKKDLMNFTVASIPDLYPGIQVSALQDSVQASVHYYYGILTDDYGFSDLRFNYSLDGERYTVIPIPVIRNQNAQEFYFEFDFAEFAGMDRTDIRYYFEVFDNDLVSGPKSTRSDALQYTIPDLNTIFDYNSDANMQVNSSLQQAEKLAHEIVSDVKELQKKMLDNTVDDWEKQQLSRDVVEKKEKLEELLQRAREENLKKSSLNKSFAGQDSVLLAKQQQIRQLLDRIMDEEMKKLLDEFSKLTQEFSKEQFRNVDEKMKLTFDQMSEQLDRNIELLKQFQVEEQHEMIRQQMEQVKELQSSLDSLSGSREGRDALPGKTEEIREKLEAARSNYEELKEVNQQLEKPFELEDLASDFEELSDQAEEQQQKNSERGETDKELAEDIKEKMEEVQEKLEQQAQQIFMNADLPESDVELIIQNILLISQSQELLLKEFNEVPPQSARYQELGRLQDLKRLEYKIVKDSLSRLAKTNLQLATVLDSKLYDIEIKFGLLPGYIQDNKRTDLLKEQQYLVTYLNDLALVLSEALQQSGGEEGGEGTPSKGKKGKGKKGSGNAPGEEGYDGLKEMQNGMKRQLENLVNQMKKGEKGQPLQQGIGNMIRQNELFRQSLEEFMSGSGYLSPGEKQLLDEIRRLLDDNIRDLSNYSVSNNLINRNNQIYNKLILSEKASREREEYEEKRRSTTAADIEFTRPQLYFKTEQKEKMMHTDFKRSDLQLAPYFRNIYNNYYIKLGDE